MIQVFHLANWVILFFQNILKNPSDIFPAPRYLMWCRSRHCFSTTTLVALRWRHATFAIWLLWNLTGWNDWKSVPRIHVDHSVISFRNIFYNFLIWVFLKVIAILLKAEWFGKWKLFVWEPWQCNDCVLANGRSAVCSVYLLQTCPSVVCSRHCNFKSILGLLFLLFFNKQMLTTLVLWFRNNTCGLL